MKKNYIEPKSLCIEVEDGQMIVTSGPIDIDNAKSAKSNNGIMPAMESKDRSGYAHDDLGWDY